MEKNSVLTRTKCSKWLDTPHMYFGCADSNGTHFEAVQIFLVMGYPYA